MKTRSLKKIICLLAVVMLMAFGLFIVSNQTTAKANPTTDITLAGASMKIDSPSGLRFEATMTKAKYEEMRLSDANFKTGILVCPEVLVTGDLTVDTDDAKNIDTTRKGFLEDEETNVRFKAYIHSVPLKNYETDVIGRAYYYYNGEYFYSAPVTKSLLDVAEIAYDTLEEGEVKTALYGDVLKPYYLHATDFGISEVAGQIVSIVDDYDSVNKGLTVTLPKYPWDGTSQGQNAIQTRAQYESGTYIMMEFLGKNQPNHILFGRTDGITTGSYSVNGVGFWLDAYGSVEAAYTGKPNYGGTGTGNLMRAYFEARPTTKFILIAGAEVNASDNTKTDLKYDLYTEKDGIVTFNCTGAINSVACPLTKGNIEIRSTLFNTNATVVKVYQPDTYANLTAKLGTIYAMDDVEEKFSKTANTTMSTNADGSYTFNMPLSENYNWVATKQAYGSGTYIMTEFVGTALPGNIIFGVNNVNDPLAISNVSGYNGQTTWNGVGLYSDHWQQPYLYSKKAGADATYTAAAGKFCRDTTASGLATSDVRVMITGVENDGENVKITNTIYTKNGTTLTQFDTQTYTINGYNVSEGSIVLSSSCCFGLATQGLKLWTIGTKTEVEAKLDAVYGNNP